MNGLAAFVGAMTGWYARAREPYASSIIVGISFGYVRQADGSWRPGMANEAIAADIIRLARSISSPVIIAQEEVATALADQGVRIEQRYVLPSFIGNTDETRSTDDMWREISRRNLITQNQAVLVVGHARHMPRIAWLGARHGFRVLIPKTVGPREFYADSSQSWTTAPAALLRHEIIAFVDLIRHK